MNSNIGDAWKNIKPEFSNFLDGIIIDDLEASLNREFEAFQDNRNAAMIMRDVIKSLIIIVEGEDLNGKVGVSGAEDFSWNPYGNDHFNTNTNDGKTVTELVLRLEWFDCCDVAEGIETAVKFALKELGVNDLHNIAEGIAGTVFKVWQEETDIHKDIKLRFDFIEL